MSVTQKEERMVDVIHQERIDLLNQLVKNKSIDFYTQRTQTGNEWHQDFVDHSLTLDELSYLQKACLTVGLHLGSTIDAQLQTALQHRSQ